MFLNSLCLMWWRSIWADDGNLHLIIFSSCFNHMLFLTLALCIRSIHVDSPPHIPSLTTSYVHGTSSVSLLSLTVGQSLDCAAQRWPDREAVVFLQDGIRKTFSQFQQDVCLSCESFFFVPTSLHWISTRLIKCDKCIFFWCRLTRRLQVCLLWVWKKVTDWEFGDPTHTNGFSTSLLQLRLELYWWVWEVCLHLIHIYCVVCC